MMTGKRRNDWAFGMGQKDDEGESFKSLLREMCESGGTMSDEEGNSFCTFCGESNGHGKECVLVRAKKMLHMY